MRNVFSVAWGAAVFALLTLPEAAFGQSAVPRAGQLPALRAQPAPPASPVKDKFNAWTVGLAGGLLEGAPLRFASEIARIVDDGDNLRVLPIVTRGPSENVEALLYLRGVDAAIINADSLAEFRTLVPDVGRRISYVLNLFPSELHILVRPEIKSLKDLDQKRVNFNTPGTSAAYSGPLIFDRLDIKAEKTFIPHQVAIEQMRRGEDGMAAVVFTTSKPVDAFARRPWPTGFKFLPVEYDRRLEDFYLPSSLTHADYPQLVPEGTEIPTISVPTTLAVFNWPKGSERYNRLTRFVDRLYSRIELLHESGYHPKWKDVNVGAAVPGLSRFSAAQEWLDAAAARAGHGAVAQASPPSVDPGLARLQAQRAARGDPAQEERLFREFMEWRRQRR